MKGKIDVNHASLYKVEFLLPPIVGRIKATALTDGKSLNISKCHLIKKKIGEINQKMFK